MKKISISLLIVVSLLFKVVSASALSVPIGRDINFPKDYDPQKAKAILKVVQDERFKFVGGLVSLWEDIGTRLSYEGDTPSLNRFLAELRQAPGIGLRVILYRGRNDEQRRDSPWQLDFLHSRPNQIGVYINLNAPGLNLEKLKLPDWPAAL